MPAEQIVARTFASCPEIGTDRLSGRFGDLELDWSTRLALPHCCSITGASVRCHVFGFPANHVASPQLAVDGKIEEAEISLATSKLQVAADGPILF
jgi:hypothetical protein